MHPKALGAKDCRALLSPSMRAYLVYCLLAVAACDGGTPAVDASAVDASSAEVSSDTFDPREAGGTCSFNRDCVASERCSCTTASGCRCVLGPRGTGRAGVDRCASGDACESALCIEGNGGAMLCSAPCETAGECPAALPRCINVATVGRFCARDPGAATDAGTPTMLTARFGSRSGGFDRAQHGRTGADGVHVEAHFGGDPACPTMTSPTPRRTFVLAGLRAGRSGVQTQADGLRCTLLDFGGELVSAPVERATAVQVTPRSVVRGVSVSLEVRATFAGGTIEGTLVAPHCASLDGP